MVLDSCVVVYGSQDTLILDPQPLIAAAEERRYRVSFMMDRGAGGQVTATVFDQSGSLVVSHTVTVVTSPPTITTSVNPEAAPGDQVGVFIRVEQETPRDLSETIRLELRVNEERWYMPATSLIAQVSDAEGGPRDISASIVSFGDRIDIALDEPVRAPFVIEVTAVGQPLWKDTEPILIDVVVLESECAEGAEAAALLTIDVCGGDLRTILFDALPVVHVKVLEHPVQNELRLQLESTQETQIRLDLLTVTGERYPLADNFPLQKGIHHCNFLTSDRAAGFYGLVVGYGSGEFVLPVVLVK